MNGYCAEELMHINLAQNQRNKKVNVTHYVVAKNVFNLTHRVRKQIKLASVKDLFASIVKEFFQHSRYFQRTKDSKLNNRLTINLLPWRQVIHWFVEC